LQAGKIAVAPAMTVSIFILFQVMVFIVAFARVIMVVVAAPVPANTVIFAANPIGAA